MNNGSNSTEAARRRYDRIAPFFDVIEGVMEGMAFQHWRALLWSRLASGDILEVGVGTGKNFPFYPGTCRMTAIDFSRAMLLRAEAKAKELGVTVDLRCMDVQWMDFPDASFDGVIGSFVFCSVPEPLRGLAEIRRVLKPGGKLVLLEHVLSERPLLAWLMNVLNPVVVRLSGANINRNTVDAVTAAGFVIDQVDHLSGIVKLVEAQRPD